MAKARKRQPKKVAEKPVTKNIRVKSAKDVVKELDVTAEKLVHVRTGKTFSKKTQKNIVSYGPWLTAATVFIVIPELLVFAKTGQIFGIAGFFNLILFNQQAWVLMVVLFINAMLLADGLSDVFAKKQRGWNRVYVTYVISALYCVLQLLQNITTPAAPIISLAILVLMLFALYDIRPYYTG